MDRVVSQVERSLVRNRVIRPSLNPHLRKAERGLPLETIHRRKPGSFPRSVEKLERGLSVMNSLLDGFGCFASIQFAKHSQIAEYAGERFSHEKAMTRMREPEGSRISELDGACYIDGSVNGNQTQYINHSCDPNADVLVIAGRLIVLALQTIVPGEEITVDYLNSFEQDQTVCQCRAASCRQRIAEKAALSLSQPQNGKHISDLHP